MKNADVLKASLDAIEAQLELARVQVQALRHAMAPLLAPKATISLLEHCAEISPIRCALQDDGAKINIGTFGDLNAWQCVGCGHVERAAHVA